MDQSDLETFLTDDIPVVLEHQVGVPDNIAKNIVHITYKDDIPEVYARLTSAVGSGAHLFMVPVRQQQEVVTIETSHRRALAEGGMEACLELLTEKDGPLYQDTMALLHAPVLIDQLKTIKALRFK
jgi:hypothetical protein